MSVAHNFSCGFQGRGTSGKQLKYESVLEEVKGQSQVGVSNQQFDAALHLLQDEEFLVVTGQTIKIC